MTEESYREGIDHESLVPFIMSVFRTASGHSDTLIELPTASGCRGARWTMVPEGCVVLSRGPGSIRSLDQPMDDDLVVNSSQTRRDAINRLLSFTMPPTSLVTNPPSIAHTPNPVPPTQPPTPSQQTYINSMDWQTFPRGPQSTRSVFDAHSVQGSSIMPQPLATPGFFTPGAQSTQSQDLDAMLRSMEIRSSAGAATPRPPTGAPSFGAPPTPSIGSSYPMEREPAWVDSTRSTHPRSVVEPGRSRAPSEAGTETSTSSVGMRFKTNAMRRGKVRTTFLADD